ncbi:MAG TPA: autotransporter-associated beta strand repeat-containing protein, partial [Gemmataceae bacterium]
MASSPFKRLFASFRPRRLSVRKQPTIRLRDFELLEDRVVPANFVWTGAAGDQSWSTDTNWMGGTAPPANTTGVTLTFDSNGTAAPIMFDDISGLKIDSMSFSASGYIIEGEAIPLTITGAASPAISDTIGGNTIGDANMPITLAGNILVNIAAGTDSIRSLMSGAFGVTKGGSGTLVLAGLNTFTGLTTISNGVLKLGVQGTATAGPLGTEAAGAAASGTVVQAGGTLDLNGFSLPPGAPPAGKGESITISGSGFNGAGAITNTSSTLSSYSGVITLAANASVIANNGALALLNSVTTNGFLLTVGGTATTGTLQNLISGTGGVTKIGTGTWLANQGSSFTGGVTISAGTYKASQSQGLIASQLGGPGGATLVNSGAALDLNGATFAEPVPLTLNGTGVGGTGAITNSSSTAATWNGPITVASDSTIAASGAAITFAGGITASAGTLKIGATASLANSAVPDFAGTNSAVIV